MDHNPVMTLPILQPTPPEVCDKTSLIIGMAFPEDFLSLASCIILHLVRSPVGISISRGLGLLRHVRLQEFLVVLEHHLKHISVENLGEISLN